MNCKQSRTKKLLEVSASKIVDNIIYSIGLDKAVLPVRRILIEIFTTFGQVMNSEYSKELLNAIESELKSVRANEIAVLTHISSVTKIS